MTISYENLMDVVSFEGFSFSNYWDGEMKILTPRLLNAGFSKIKFSMGECDSFGPLTRICTAVDKDNRVRHFIYG
jgi:hypothetical protein